MLVDGLDHTRVNTARQAKCHPTKRNICAIVRKIQPTAHCRLEKDPYITETS